MSEKTALLLKDFLRLKRLTVTDFARASQLSRMTIYKYLNGENIPLRSAKKIEKGLLEKYDLYLPHKSLID
jgi:predicted transcriptional regulator